MRTKPSLKSQTTTPARLLVLSSLLLFLFGAPASARAAHKIPDSAWQTGTLRNVTSNTHSRVLGVMNNGQGMVGTQVRIVWRYTIESSLYIYEADRTARRRDKALDVTINAPVRFAVVGMDLYVRDDAGKVHKLAIATKTLKTENGSSK